MYLSNCILKECVSRLIKSMTVSSYASKEELKFL